MEVVNALGRRKRAIARIFVSEGTGKITINKRDPSGALEVELVPRSGRHTIVFGRIEQVERKFDKLLCFYRSGLMNQNRY